jgi:outer membrane murein-binding lipoprotein Lpp
MTENELVLTNLSEAVTDLSKAVTDQRYELGIKLATLTTNVGTLQTSHDTNAKKLDRVLELELGCPARAGLKGINARIGKLETGEKLRIESELQEARDEITGQQDVMQRRAGERNYSETPTGRFVKFIMPYVWKGLVVFGIIVGTTVAARCTGEDPAVTANALRAVTDMVERTATDVKEVKVKVDEAAADTDAEMGLAR